MAWSATGYAEDGIVGTVDYTPAFNKMNDGERRQASFLLECVVDSFVIGVSAGAYTFEMSGHVTLDLPDDPNHFVLSLKPTAHNPALASTRVSVTPNTTVAQFEGEAGDSTPPAKPKATSTTAEMPVPPTSPTEEELNKALDEIAETPTGGNN